MNSYALRRLLGTALLVVPMLLLGVAPATAADTCDPSQGVGVVVEPGDLGGEPVESCAPDGSGVSAQKVFTSAGVDLGFYKQMPEFACTVNGLPKGVACTKPGTGGYWGLFWTDGKKSEWTFSMKSVVDLTVPEGGKVAWVWQTGKTPTPPDVATDAALSEQTPAAKDSKDAKDSSGSKESENYSATSMFVVGALIAVLIVCALVAYALRKRDYDN